MLNHLSQNKKLYALLLGLCACHLIIALSLYGWANDQSPDNPLHAHANILRAPDALMYYSEAKHIAQSWSGELPESAKPLSSIQSYSVVLGVVFYVFGSNYIWGVLLNCLSVFIVGWLAYHIALMLGKSNLCAGLTAAVICMWPPYLAWTAILLKDPLIIACVFCFIYVLMRSLSSNESSAISGILNLAVMFASIVLMISMRKYFAYVLFVILPVISLLFLLSKSQTVRLVPRRQMAAFCALSLLMVLAALLMPIHTIYQGAAPAKQIAQLKTPEKLFRPLSKPVPYMAKLRRDFVGAGGKTIAQTQLQVFQTDSNSSAAINEDQHLLGRVFNKAALAGAYAVNNLFLRPYPWEQMPPNDTWSPVNYFFSAVAVYWYLLLIGVIVGICFSIKRSRPQVTAIIVWVVMVGLPLSLVVANFGTLFRIRDVVIMPLLLLVDFSLLGYVWAKLSSLKNRQYISDASDRVVQPQGASVA